MSKQKVLSKVETIQAWQEDLYKYFHQHPELSMQETNTVQRIGEVLEENKFSVQKIGGGVVGTLVNGDGPTLLFRADIDALPIKEMTGFDYASRVEVKDSDGELVPVMHACGHDFHITSALGVAKILGASLDDWSGTCILLFQPGEETAAGAKSMLADGLIDKIEKPDAALAQHVLTEPEAGKVGIKAGPFLSSAASIKIVVKGQGSHGSMPHLSIDPVVIASSIVMKLQTIVSREINPLDFAVVTVGSIQSGLKANVIPDDATLLLNIRAYDSQIKAHLIHSIERIATDECLASGCKEKPLVEIFDNYPLTENDAALAEKIEAAFIEYFGRNHVVDYKPMTASEDFSYLPDAFGIPYCYWGFGGFTSQQEVYPNHSGHFGPALQPTLKTGTEAALTAVLSFLGK